MATSIQATHTSMSIAEEQVFWLEIINSLTHGSELYKAAFAQLQGSPEPFEAAVAVLAALPEGTFDLC
jgi:hypothetical protein